MYSLALSVIKKLDISKEKRQRACQRNKNANTTQMPFMIIARVAIKHSIRKKD